MAEGPLVQGLCVFPGASQPSSDGGLSKAEDPFGSRWVQPFGQRGEHHGDLLGRGFQPVERSIASSAERGAARLTTKRLDALSMPMPAIAEKPHG